MLLLDNDDSLEHDLIFVETSKIVTMQPPMQESIEHILLGRRNVCMRIQGILFSVSYSSKTDLLKYEVNIIVC